MTDHEKLFARAAEIYRDARIRHENDIHAALVELCGSMDVADFYIKQWEDELLALQKRAWEIAEKERITH